MAISAPSVLHYSAFIDFVAMQNNRQDRNAVRSQASLWPNGEVPYAFKSSVSPSIRAKICAALNIIEQQTCIRFVIRSNQADYVEFRSYDSDDCASYVGRQGGKQSIWLGPGCHTTGIILHEVSHALGLFHEHSRPDRDNYIKILTDNIRPSIIHNFRKRTSYEVDYRGTDYDYNSVMHYSINAFSVNGRNTILVSNTAVYNHQGRPVLGASTKTQLSSLDAIQLKRIYNCPGALGILEVYVIYGRNLPDSDPGLFQGYSDIYVRVTAVTDSLQSTTQNTHKISNGNPAWNKWLYFGVNWWQYIEMSTWDSDSNADDVLIRSQKFPISAGYYAGLKHCADAFCLTHVVFDYHLIPDGDECSPNPCRRGTCLDLISDFRCNCPSNYRGRRCELLLGRLRVYVKYANGLPNRDGWPNQQSDAYVRVTARNFRTGTRRSFQTGHISNNNSPTWNTNLYFGLDAWYQFDLEVFDKDSPDGDDLICVITYSFHSHITLTTEVKNCGGGQITFNYSFQ